MRTFKVTRAIAGRNDILTFDVSVNMQVLNRGPERYWTPGAVADELAYAVAYKRGVFDGEKRIKPFGWALKAVSTQGVIPA